MQTKFTEVIVSKGGEGEHTIDVAESNVPDLWHAAMRLKDEGDELASANVLRCWHLAHAMRNHIIEGGVVIKNLQEALDGCMTSMNEYKAAADSGAPEIGKLADMEKDNPALFANEGSEGAALKLHSKDDADLLQHVITFVTQGAHYFKEFEPEPYAVRYNGKAFKGTDTHQLVLNVMQAEHPSVDMSNY